MIRTFWKWWYTHIRRSTPRYTRPEALAIARKYNLEYEVIKAMDHGCNPDEALQEWDIYPYDSQIPPKP